MGDLPRIGFYAANYYYVDHLVSIWLSLPVEARGIWWVTDEAASRLDHYGISRKEHAKVFSARPDLTNALKRVKTKGPVVTASYGEWKQVRLAGHIAPYLPHGQGGAGNSVEAVWKKHLRDLPVMFCASEHGLIDGLPCYPLDGQPKVDRWLGHKPENRKPVVAISFRWRESTCALDHYKGQLKHLIRKAKENGWEILGHGHPLRWRQKFKPLWQSLGVKFTGDFEKVMRTADIYCADASGTSFEFAATGRPIVFLDCPSYEDKHETLWHRFSHAHAGMTCTNPQDLASVIHAALLDPPEQQELRAQAIAEIFGKNDGLSSVRAGQYLIDMFSNGGGQPC